MSSPEIQDQVAPEIPEDKLEKEEMVDHLTSEGKIGNKLAGDLYDAGLDNWKALVTGDEEFFTSFKGVGKVTAGKLVELGESKRNELEEQMKKPTLDEVLNEIPRLSASTVNALKENGYDTFGKFKDLDPEELTRLKGIGPKLSVTIVERVNEARESFGISEEEVIVEDAIGTQEGESVEDRGTEEKGFFQKLIEGIKAIFQGKKEEPAEQENETGPAPENEEEETDREDDTGDQDKEETPVEEPVDEVSRSDGEPEDEKIEVSADREVEPEEVEEPEKAEEDTTDETDEPEKEASDMEASVDEATEPQVEEKGFFQKLKEKLFGAAEESSTEQEKTEEPPEEPPVQEAEEDEPEQKVEEDKQEENQGSDEAPAEEGPLGIKGVDPEVQKRLKKAGYLNVDELKEAVPDDLVMIDGIDEETAKRICDAVKS